MKTNLIKLGYKFGTDKEYFIKPSHLIVSGVTQLSGKTTTLEALIKRSGLKAIVFKTKIGEKSFSEGTETAPFFRDRSDYEFVKSLIEAYSKEKLFLEKGTLMRLCKGSSSLLEIKKKVDESLLGKLRSIEQEIYTRLQHYLENLIPQIQYANLSKTLTVYEGINIMNLERFTVEVQALIIQSVADEVLNTMKGTILVIPEAWKFLPQKYNSPCKRVVISFIRQGATNDNYVWIDSQDMSGVDKEPLKQISNWIMGYQAERNEVKHTLDEISLPKKLKPTEDEIMNLKKGQFFVSSYDGVEKVYVQPIWMDDLTAVSISNGNKSVEDVKKPDNLVPFAQAINKSENKMEIRFDDSQIRKDINELRIDFFNKIQDLQNFNNSIAIKVYSLESSKVSINEDEIIAKVLQKMPINNSNSNSVIDKDAIIKEVISRMPKSAGNVTYEVSPLEKIKKDFLIESKEKILSDVSNLSNDAKKTLKYLESRKVGCKTSEIAIKGFLLSQGGGGSADRINKSIKELESINLALKDKGGTSFGKLKERISELTLVHEATEKEIEQVYNHILMEILK